MGAPLARSDPCGCRASQAGRDGLSGFGADHAPGGCGGQAALARRPRAQRLAVDHRARALDAMGLRQRARDRSARDDVVLRVAGLEPLPGGDRAAREDGRVGGDGLRPCATSVRWGPDLRLDGQREDGLGRSRRRDRGPQRADRRGRPPLRPLDRDLRPGRPAEQGGSEATVRVAKADLVGTDHNLRASYASFAEYGSCSPRGEGGATRPRSGCVAATLGRRRARPSTPGTQRSHRSPRPPSRRSEAWNDSSAPRRSASAAPPGRASRSWSRRSDTSRSTAARRSPGTPSNRWQ